MKLQYPDVQSPPGDLAGTDSAIPPPRWAASAGPAAEHAGAWSPGSDQKPKVAWPSPPPASSSPSGRKDPDRSLPSFRASQAEPVSQLPSAFSLHWQARPVRSLPEGGERRVSGLRSRSPEAGKAGPQPLHAAGRGFGRGAQGTKGERANPRASDLGNAASSRVWEFPTDPLHSPYLTLPPPHPHRSFSPVCAPVHRLLHRPPSAFFSFFFKRLASTRPRRGRSGRGAQPFPPRPGPPFPPEPAD